jgi:hypothetical protein
LGYGHMENERNAVKSNDAGEKANVRDAPKEGFHSEVSELRMQTGQFGAPPETNSKAGLPNIQLVDNGRNIAGQQNSSGEKPPEPQKPGQQNPSGEKPPEPQKPEKNPPVEKPEKPGTDQPKKPQTPEEQIAALKQQLDKMQKLLEEMKKKLDKPQRRGKGRGRGRGRRKGKGRGRARARTKGGRGRSKGRSKGHGKHRSPGKKHAPKPNKTSSTTQLTEMTIA